MRMMMISIWTGEEPKDGDSEEKKGNLTSLTRVFKEEESLWGLAQSFDPWPLVCFRGEGLQVLPEDVGQGEGDQERDHQRPAEDEPGENVRCYTVFLQTQVWHPGSKDGSNQVSKGVLKAACTWTGRHRETD